MAVPIFDGDRITAVGAVANSVSPYEITDVRSLISLYERLWEIIRRKISEETLRESEERFKALHNASFGGIAIHDKGIILECNQGLADMTGYSADELIGMNGLLLIAEKSRDIVMSNILSGYEKPYEAYGLRKNGQEFPMRLEARNVPYKGKSVRTVEFRDITESKESADQLLRNEALLQNITENMHDLVALTDMLGNFTFVGKSHKILGYEPEYLIGRNVMEFVHPEDISYVTEGFTKWLTEGQESAITEYRYRCADGTYIWLETVGRLVRDAEGNVKELIFSSRDVTERKKNEDKISLLLKEKELLLKETHHRVKNNIDAVQSLLYLQSEELSDPVSKGIIKDAALRVQKMMVLYDTLYRSDNHKEMKVNDYLPSFINEIIRIFGSPIPVKTDISVDDVVLSSKVLSTLGIIINELITNSMKYAFNTLSEGLISLSLTEKDKRVTVVYRDNGPGLPESVNFENSTGFGMKLIGMLAQQLGGDIRIERGEGTGFVFDFHV